MAVSRRIHLRNKAAGESATCGPAQLDRMLTQARQAMSWLRGGASVPQQQTIRDFAKSRAKALKDIRAGLPPRRRAGMPRAKRKHEALPTLNYTRRGFRIKEGRLHLAGDISLAVVWSRALPSDPTSVRVYQDSLGDWYASFVVVVETQPLFLAKTTMARTAADAAIAATKAALIQLARKHDRALYLVHPMFTTMDCALCGARAKHRLPLSERTYTCTACGVSSPRDKNSARLMLVRAGLDPASVDLVSAATC